MYNHFRTLLLNESYNADPAEHIPSTFSRQELPDNLLAFYNLLFPANSSRFYKIFLTHAYLSLIHAAGLEAELSKFDPRITYDLAEATEYFKFFRTSNVVYGTEAEDNADFYCSVVGKYTARTELNDHFDMFVVSQTGEAEFNIYSQVTDALVVNPESGDTTFNIATDSIPGVSHGIKVGNTGISFTLYLPHSFDLTGNKSWSFLVDAPLSFDFNQILTRLNNSSGVVSQMLDAPAWQSEVSYENFWHGHFSDVYRLAGLLLAFGNRLDFLYHHGSQAGRIR